MISRLTINANLILNTKRFLIIKINDIRRITPYNFPMNFICLEGILNEVNKTVDQIQQYHNKYFNIVELRQIRMVFGDYII